MVCPRNARAEATSLLPAGHEARVLEPSPPALNEEPWFADDPVATGGAVGIVVSPVPGTDLTWDEMVGRRPDLAEYAADHWLGGLRPLHPLPPGHLETRRTLHQLAFFALAPLRYERVGKMGLRYTHAGFGTPFFADDVQARMEGTSLVLQRSGEAEATRPETLADACAFLGIDYRAEWFPSFRDPPPPADPAAPLELDEQAAEVIADWFGFVTHVLERLRAAAAPEEEVSRCQLWPEHFDPAVELGSASARASYGGSPGDDHHDAPYLYVAAWETVDRSNPFWNDRSFNGASLPYQELLGADDQRAAALEFFQRGRRLLAGG